MIRTRTTLILGLSIIFTIFAISNIVQWNYSQDLKAVSEYHNSMGIPSLDILDDINLSYNKMHLESQQILLGVENLIESDNTRANYYNALQQYNFLTYEKNSNNEYFSHPTMINMMQSYVAQFNTNFQSYEMILSEFHSGAITQREAASSLSLTKSEFDRILNEAIQMEMLEIENTNNTINVIESNLQTSLIIFNISMVSAALIMIINVSRFISQPLSSLVSMTKKISTGNFKTTKLTTNNSDVNEVMNAINIMSENLEQHKTALIQQEKLSSMGTLSSRLAHDIRNPLSILKGTFDLMKTQKEDQLSQEDLEKFDRIERAIQRISHQIYHVLDFIQGKPLSVSRHSLHDILDSTMADISKSEKIKIENIGSDVEIDCDFEGLKIVMINLIINAMQAIGIEGTIKINVIDKIDHVLIEVEDSGPGIPEDNLDTIFEPLFTTKQEGTGLGLASCKSIIEQHSGTISVQNNPTRFTINLPKIIKQKETILQFEK